MHSYDKHRACPDCGDLDGCHIPGKVKRHRPFLQRVVFDDGTEKQQHVNLCARTEARESMYGQAFPKVVCLCGSTRFIETFQKMEFAETLEGNIVLTIGCDTKSDGELFKGPHGDAVKAMLDELHKRKIDHADEILVLNVGGYIGSSTRGEIEYALRTGKKVRYLETEVDGCPKIAPPATAPEPPFSASPAGNTSAS